MTLNLARLGCLACSWFSQTLCSGKYFVNQASLVDMVGYCPYVLIDNFIDTGASFSAIVLASIMRYLGANNYVFVP